MPVTARLLQRLHEALGDDATNDLLAWWEESVVTRGELREAINATAERFSGELAQGLSAVRAEMAVMKSELRAEMANQRADLLKWMFIFWAGTVIPLAGLMIALTRS